MGESQIASRKSINIVKGVSDDVPRLVWPDDIMFLTRDNVVARYAISVDQIQALFETLWNSTGHISYR